MLALANYSMKGPKQATLVVVLLSLLTIWIAPIGMLAGAIIALITLRINEVEGAKALIWAMLVQIALTLSLTGSYWPALIAVVEFLLPVYVLAVVVRRSNDLAHALQVAVLMVAIGLLGFHFLAGDTTQWWLNLYQQQIQPVLDNAGVEYQVELIPQLAKMATMLMAVFVLVLWFSILTLGRWYQSQLYCPGEFQRDFHQLKLPKNLFYAAISIAVGGLFLSEQIPLLYDLTGVVMAAWMFQGISLVHFMVKQREASSAWLVGMYLLLFLLPQMMLILATIGLIDNWMNFRGREDRQ
ncbi:MAG: DUF2232 domain-containing protein [Thiotrichales bacterium]|nr:DUF2232 domain-containing protein [Thiotrichales bacterium]